jgi:hypothetical protein
VGENGDGVHASSLFQTSKVWATFINVMTTISQYRNFLSLLSSTRLIVFRPFLSTSRLHRRLFEKLKNKKRERKGIEVSPWDAEIIETKL